MSTPSNPQPTPVAATQIRVQAQRRQQGAASLVFTPDLIYIVDSYTGNPNEIVMTGPTGIINPNLLPPSSNIQLLTNGVINVDQSRLNLVQGTNIVITADAFGNTTISASGSFSTSFGSITTGDNTTATMTVDSGASIIVAGTGVVEATELATNTATPVATNVSAPTHAGQILVSQPGNGSAIWVDPQVLGLYPEGTPANGPLPPYAPPTTVQPVMVAGKGTSPSGKDGLMHDIPLTEAGQAVYIAPNPQVAAVGGLVDAFGRARVSTPTTLFEGNYQLAPAGFIIPGPPPATVLQYSPLATGGGTVQLLNPEPAIELAVTTAAGDRAVWQTKSYWIGQAGKSVEIQFYCVLNSNVAGVIQRAGFYDDNLGYFFEQNGVMGTMRVVTRGFFFGDVGVDQVNWNIDPMNGTGNSGITLDFSKYQDFVIDVGSLRIRFGVYIGGVLYYVHQVLAGNVSNPLSNGVAFAPIRFEILNPTGSAAGNVTKHLSMSVMVESGYEDAPSAYAFSVNTGISLVTGIGATLTPILSIRPALTISGGKTNRSFITLRDFSVITAGQIAQYVLVYNGTLTGATWAGPLTGSAVQYDTAATQITGGRVVDSGFVGVTNQNTGYSQNKFPFRLPFTLDITGTVQDVYTLCVAAVGGGSVSAGGAFKWQELR